MFYSSLQAMVNVYFSFPLPVITGNNHLFSSYNELMNGVLVTDSPLIVAF